MYEYLFKPYIVSCLTMYGKKFPYDFTIRFYNPSLFCIFRAVLKMYF